MLLLVLALGRTENRLSGAIEFQEILLFRSLKISMSETFVAFVCFVVS